MRMQTRQSNSARSPQDGFTVLELMVVVAIFGILVVASAASMKLAERPTLHRACEYLVSDLIRARNEAIKEEDRCTFTFDFNPNTRGYQYVMQNSGNGKAVSLGERWGEEVYFLPGSPGGADAPPDVTFAFTPRGNLNSLNNGIIYLTTRDGLNMGVGKVYRIMSSLTGEIECHVRDFTNATWFEF